ncbi:MAG TPA: Bax inhibitor-1/YccA family protein [Gemmatimonadaceae bacterium]
MARSNPALKESVFRTALADSYSERMTITGTVTKAMILIVLTAFSAAWVWQATMTNPAIVGPAVLVGALGGLAVSFVAIFKPSTAPYTAPLYAVLEGLALGAISAIYEVRYHGLPVMAVGLTLMVALGMLLSYQTGLIRATDTFRRVIISATGGIMLFYLLSIGMRFFGVQMPLINDAGPLGIGLSVVFTAVAALNLVLDFDLIERGAKQGAPKYMEWYGGFALLVTLVWLYLEILRLLGKMRR